jgi:hypothetical protein
VVAITTSEERTPTVVGLNTAWKEKLAPAATVRGTTGIPLILKSGFPVSVMFETVIAILAVHWTVLAAVVLPMFCVPKSYGDEQFNGRLTGAPKP